MASNVYRKSVATGDVGTGAGEVGLIVLTAGPAAAAVIILNDGTSGNPVANLAAVAGTSACAQLHGRTIQSSVWADTFTGAGAVVTVEMI